MINLETNKIDLRQKRAFSELISITFEFIRENIKIISRSFLVFSLPLILLGSILSYIIGYTMPSITSANLLGNILIAAGTLFYSMAINIIISNYVEMENPKELTISMIWAQIGKNIGAYIGGGFLVGIIFIVGILLLLIPGIYFGIALSFVFFIIIHEKLGVADSIKRSYELSKGYWWGILGFLLIMIIIQATISYSVIIPLTFLSMWLLRPIYSGEMGADGLNDSYLLILAVITLVMVMFYNYISAIINVAIAAKYFSVVEEKENIGLQDEIDAMGTQTEQD